MLLALAAIACSSWPTKPPTPTPTASPSPTTAPTDTPQPISTATATSAPALIQIEIQGSASFIAQTQAALGLLAVCAPEAFEVADDFLDSIQESERSGMMVGGGTFLASETTAFAPGYSSSAQVFWYAGAIIHDAHHIWQSRNGMTVEWESLTLDQREAIEADARGVQIVVLQECVDDLPVSARLEGDHMVQYLVDMQEGRIPCDYCRVEWENRNW